MNENFRKATLADVDAIWEILKAAIERRRLDGSSQWQDGYPNPVTIQNDIAKGQGFVLTLEEEIIGYVAAIVNDEPAYESIEGKWLTNGDFVVVHRVAIAKDYLKKGWAEALLKYVETWALQQGIYSIKADTSFDNPGMLRVFIRMGYVYCGEVLLRESPRKAFEKLIK